LKAGEWFRRGRLIMVSPVHGDYRRCQAEIPLIILCRFPGPALKYLSHSEGSRLRMKDRTYRCSPSIVRSAALRKLGIKPALLTDPASARASHVSALALLRPQAFF
jgi:hypothetical protein